MFPLRDDNPTLRAPLATIGVVAITLLAWLLVQGLGMEPTLSQSVCDFGLIPGELLGKLRSGTIFRIGPGVSCEIVHSSARILTPLTSMFMHGSWFHIVGNLWFLWVFGDNVEDVMGRFRFVIFYLLCGLGAATAQTLSAPASHIPMVGASGAIGGVMGAYAILYPRARVQTLLILGFYMRTVEVQAAFMLGYWFLLQILGGLPTIGTEAGGVAFWAHVGGFLAGVVLLFVFRNPELVAAQRVAAQGALARGRLGYEN
jgi:membrane associated rhomboid family serine protease